MKLELGQNSKILGTKRVSAKGQISGLKDYAGEDVLVILAGDDYSESSGRELPHEVVYKELQKLVEAQMKQAFKNYKQLNEKFKTPNEASREFLKKMGGEITERVLVDLNKWLETILPEERKDDEDKL